MQQTLSLDYSEEPQICGTCYHYFNRSIDGVRLISCTTYGYRKEIKENPNCKPAYCKAWESDKVKTDELLRGL